jgi:hypothetical protein
LVDLLNKVQSLAGRDFSGIGIVICDVPEALPMFPIRLANNKFGCSNLIDDLVKISSLHSEFHDGFHVISSNFELAVVAQYFSPPIVEDVKIDRTKRFGGRYLAALFGSSLPKVRMVGIASNGFGLAIFQHGVEIYFKPVI